jgi:hypothetical protein
MTIAYRAPSHPGMGYPAFVDPKPRRRVRAPAEGEPTPPARPDPATFPRVDTPLVRPETREELFHGRLVVAAPAHLPHARRQAKTASVAEFTTAADYQTATELLTCTGTDTNFATDVCILRKGIDPATGARYLEELVFEVVNEQSLPDITERARDLTARGVRRIIAIFVKTDEIREWSSELDDWALLDLDGTLEDRSLIQPIPVRALLDGAAADDTVVRALYTKRNPALLEIEAAGIAAGITQSIVALCSALGIPLDADRRATMQSLDIAGLQVLLVMLGTERRWP